MSHEPYYPNLGVYRFPASQKSTLNFLGSIPQIAKGLSKVPGKYNGLLKTHRTGHALALLGSTKVSGCELGFLATLKGTARLYPARYQPLALGLSRAKPIVYRSPKISLLPPQIMGQKITKIAKERSTGHCFNPR